MSELGWFWWCLTHGKRCKIFNPPPLKPYDMEMLDRQWFDWSDLWNLIPNHEQTIATFRVYGERRSLPRTSHLKSSAHRHIQRRR